jgi:hypothetical protein
MLRIRRLLMAALLLAAGLVPAQTASAGPILSWLYPDDGPAPAYSPFRYWAPGLGRANDIVHGPRIGVYAPDRRPEVPPTYLILRFPCPAADPSTTLIPLPTPPAESKAH